MKTTPLAKVLTQITPLPYKRAGLYVSRDMAGETGQRVAYACMDGGQPEQIPTANYLTHAANVLPDLVEALEQLLANFVTEDAYPEYVCGAANDRFVNLATVETKARHALSIATNVPTP